MKINIGQKKDPDQNLDYLYENYRPAKSPLSYGGYRQKGAKDYKWIMQLLVSGVILLLVAGLFKSELPYTGVLKSGVKYLMTAETNFQPVMQQVVGLATQIGSVEWPVTEDLPTPVRPAITRVPSEAVLLLPVSGNVLRNYGWYTDPGDKVQKFNEGIDISTPVGTSVRASCDGKVIKTVTAEGQGKSILMESKYGDLIRYANLSEINVQTEQAVKAGEIIGKSGLAPDKEPYVHFEVIIDSRPVDPLTRLGLDFTKITGVKGPEQK